MPLATGARVNAARGNNGTGPGVRRKPSPGNPGLMERCNWRVSMIDRQDHPLWDEAREFLPATGSLLFFSFVITLMYLVPSLYMYQIFERVMHSRSASTLIALATIMAFLCVVWTVLEQVRARTLQQIGNALSVKVSHRVFDALNRETDRFPAASRGLILQDLAVLRDFVAGTLIIQAMDCLWVPLVIIAAALYHPILGAALLGMTIIVTILALLTQRVARDDALRSLAVLGQANEFGRAVMRSAEGTRVIGMMPALVARWCEQQNEGLGWQQSATDRTAIYTAVLRLFRHMYVPISLTIGVVLFLNEQVGAGVIFASIVIVGRAIQPVDALANNWRAFWNVSLSAQRLDRMLRESAKRTRRVSLPAPDGPLAVSRIAAAPAGREALTITDVSFTVNPGSAVGIVGASGAGKSSLARVLVGAWPLRRGSITLDGQELSHWDQDELGRHIGYVPQDVDLLPGTVAENIARFDPPGPETDARVIEAVRLANVQDIVGRLPEGLNTRLGPDGHVLSGGQRQRIALARAVYGDPRLVVLDEPNSNLDAAGEQNLAAAIAALRERRVIVVLITHRMNMLTYCDHVLVMNSGTVLAFGARDQILDRLAGSQTMRKLTDQNAAPAASGKVIAA
jgi:PrtD family type I secretion system ABC transporter